MNRTIPNSKDVRILVRGGLRLFNVRVVSAPVPLRALLPILTLLAVALALAPAGSAGGTGIKLRLAEPTVTADQVELSWSYTGKPSGKLRYQVIRDNELLAGTRKMAYTDEDVEVGETHSYRIRAISLAAGSRPALSNTVQVTIAEPESEPEVDPDPKPDPEPKPAPKPAPLPPTQPLTPLTAEKVNDDLGSGRTMSTWVEVSRKQGQIHARTRIATTDFWVGYHGAVYVNYRDQDGELIGVSGIHRFGVDGLIIVTNPHDITVLWDEEIAPVVAQRIASLEIVHMVMQTPDVPASVKKTRDTICTFWNLFSVLIGPCPVPEVSLTENG